MAGIEGVEPPTYPLGGGRSIQLSYIPAESGAVLPVLNPSAHMVIPRTVASNALPYRGAGVCWISVGDSSLKIA